MDIHQPQLRYAKNHVVFPSTSVRHVFFLFQCVWTRSKHERIERIAKNASKDDDHPGNFIFMSIEDDPFFPHIFYSNLASTFGAFHSHGGTPIAGWFISEIPWKLGWWLGVPLWLRTSISSYFQMISHEYLPSFSHENFNPSTQRSLVSGIFF